MRMLMTRDVSIFRTEETLINALEGIKALRKRVKNVRISHKGLVHNLELREVLELMNMLNIADVVIVSALNRIESRGAHTRLDYPKRDDDNWLKHTLAFYSANGPRLEFFPVTITKWKPVERSY